MPTVHTTTYTSVFSGQNVGPAFPQYNSISIDANTTLSWPSGFQNLNPVVAVNMDITATVGGLTVKMPDAEGAGTGYAIKINNPGNFSFNLIDNTSNLIVTIPSGTTKEIWLINNSTSAGTWRTFPNPGGGAAVTSINATSSSNNLVVTGTPGLPITSAGTIQFALANDLLSLSSFGASTGIAVRTAANTWAMRNIAGTVGQILITNPSGVAGDMTISLSNVLTNLVSIGVGNLSLSGNTIAATNANGNVIITSQGTGNVQLSKNTQLLAASTLKFYDAGNNFYISFKAGTTAVNQDLVWPTTAPTNGQVLSHTAAGQLSWASVPTTGGGTTILNSIARYSNAGGALTDSVVIIDNAGNISGANTAQISNLLLGTIGQATISTQLTDQDLTFAPNGLGLTISKTDLLIRPNATSQSKLRLYNNANNFYAGVMANPSMAANYTWVLPIAGNTAGFFYTDAANNMSINPATSFFPAASTLNAVPRYSNTTGYPLKDSLLVVSDTGAATGLISSVIGNISISTTANTISSSSALSLTCANNMVLTAPTLLTIDAATSITNANDSTSSTTGSCIFSGGVGIAKRLNVATQVAIGVNRAIALSAFEVVGAGGINVTDGGAPGSIKQFNIVYNTGSNRTEMTSIQQGVGSTDIFFSCSNIGLNGTSYGSGNGVIFIANRVTAPTTNPVNGGILYTASGALRYRGSSGTDTQIAPA